MDRKKPEDNFLDDLLDDTDDPSKENKDDLGDFSDVLDDLPKAPQPKPKAPQMSAPPLRPRVPPAAAKAPSAPSAPAAPKPAVHMDSADDILDMASDIPVQVVAVLGKKSINMKEMLDLKIGEVVDLGRPLNETVDLVANGKLIARGELVDIDNKMGVRIVKMVK